MTIERETLRIVGEWLEEGRTAVPGHVLDAVLDQLPTKPQRRPWWPARRVPTVTAFAKYAIGAAAMVAVAIVGVSVLQAPGQGSPPSLASPSPSVVASPTLSPSPPPSASTAGAVPFGALDPGRYAWAWEGGTVSFAVEDGWTADAAGIAKGAPDTPGEYGLGPNLPGTPAEITHVYADACQSEGQLQPIGPTVDDLVTALENQGGTETVKTYYAVGRALGWRVEIRGMPGLDRAECRHGADGPLQIWADEAETGFFALAPGHWGRVYAFDLDGRRVIFTAGFGPEATDLAVQQVEDIIDSLDFGPSAAGSLPNRSLPGTRASAGGEYGWEGEPGDRAGMHKVNESEGREVAALTFAVGPDCLTERAGQEALPIRLAGFDGVSIEPYEPPVTFGAGDDPVTRAHALAVGIRTLCVFLTWESTTTADELAAAEDVLDTLRAVPVGGSRIRITFTLDEGWDTG
jgi:hypothetical protein